MDWDALTAISTLAATLIILFTAVFTIMQLNEMRRSRRLELFMRLFGEFSSPRTRENRKYIYTRLPSDPSQLTGEDFLIIDDVLAGLDRAWILIQHKQLEPRFILDTYGEIFLRLWGVLYPIVLHERERRGPYYRERSEALIEMTRGYFKKKGREIDYRAYVPGTAQEAVEESKHNSQSVTAQPSLTPDQANRGSSS